MTTEQRELAEIIARVLVERLPGGGDVRQVAAVIVEHALPEIADRDAARRAGISAEAPRVVIDDER